MEKLIQPFHTPSRSPSHWSYKRDLYKAITVLDIFPNKKTRILSRKY